ncbi:MAG: lipid II:glycine glycyltransferase FemX [Syntrophomonadaceae bacterium]|jgi:peptidoglycan pentaglycine glycine transferase (the first glycine)
MYTSRIIDEKDKDSYTRFVSQHPKGHFLQLWEWGQVKHLTGWEPLALVLEKDGRIKAAMLILKRTLPVPLIKRSIFYAPRGPIADQDNEEEHRLLFAEARRIARRQGAIFLKIDPDIGKENTAYADLLARCGFRHHLSGVNFEGVQPNHVMRLDLSPGYDELLANMHGKWRYNIRLAARRGVIITQADSKADLKLFYTILEETAQRDQFLIRSYAYFESIWDYMVANGYARIFLAHYQGETVAGTMAFILGDKAWYLYGASSNRHRNVMPNYLLQWEMISWAKEQGCQMYDFRGVSGDMDESNPLFGLYRFKKGFNGVLTEFIGEWDFVYRPGWYWVWTRLLPLYLGRRRSRSVGGGD